jgi:hypothetical protein
MADSNGEEMEPAKDRKATTLPFMVSDQTPAGFERGLPTASGSRISNGAICQRKR